MVVQVVDPTPDPSVLKFAVCRHCGARLSYVPNDMKDDYSTDYTGCKDPYKYIDCGKCGKEVVVRGY